MSGGPAISRIFVVLVISSVSACSLWPLSEHTEPPRQEVTKTQKTATPAAPDAGATNTDTAAAVTPAPQFTEDLWHHIGVELRMEADQILLAKPPLAYFNNSTRFINEATERARPFLHHIVTQIEARGLPHEIALIPIIESAYNPQATSPAGAAGIWQFMPATGRRFGLSQSKVFDARRDVVQSTDAALSYFEILRDRFMGDWQLVFAAYNCGGRTVERAIERNQRRGLPTHFAALELPAATKTYVPKLLALTEILGNPSAFGVEPARIAGGPYFEMVDVQANLALAPLGEKIGLNAEKFAELNAAYRQGYTDSHVATRVAVPLASVAEFRDALTVLPDTSKQASRVYEVISGDTLSHIAARSGVPISTIQRVNGLKHHRLSIGQKLSIPSPFDISSAPQPAPDTSQTVENARIHVVQRGDNLWDLARHYKTDVTSLRRLNGLPRKPILNIGQRLQIPTGTTAPARSASNGVQHYQVQRGDSLWTIAKRFNISVSDLKRWNALSQQRFLKPGQQLIVAQPAPGHRAQML